MNNCFRLSKFKKSLTSFMCAAATTFMLASHSFATTPKLVTGTVNLFNTATTWLLLLIPAGAGLFLGYQAFQKSMTEDQAVIAEKNKLMKNVVIGAAIAETASGLIKILLSFYQ